ncbi:MAG: hypothetical protein ACK5KR_05935, partial [Breznakia sp.]
QFKIRYVMRIVNMFVGFIIIIAMLVLIINRCNLSEEFYDISQDIFVFVELFDDNSLKVNEFKIIFHNTMFTNTDIEVKI